MKALKPLKRKPGKDILARPKGWCDGPTRPSTMKPLKSPKRKPRKDAPARPK